MTPELSDTHPTLTDDEAARLIEFARACKAAARAVQLYPLSHPAIAATLGRIALITSPGSLATSLVVTVLPDRLLLRGRAPARADAALAELAGLLHSHLIGQLTVHPGGDVDAWRTFLLLLGRTPESVRAEGGIARAWTAMAGRHLELREIDYTEVLRERSGGETAVWNRVISNCLHGSALDLDESAIADLIRLAGDAERMGDLMSAVETQMPPGDGMGARSSAVIRMLRGIIDIVSKNAPERLEPVLQNMASAVGQFSPEMLLGLLEQRREGDDGAQLVQAVVTRMSEGTIARFVSRHVIAGDTPTHRLAQAFQTLVRDSDQQHRLLALARSDVEMSPLGSTEGFESVWNHVAQKLLTSYSDKTYVSEEYGRELSGARTQAVDVERVSADPQERVTAWLDTIATSALRALDLTLILDLLRIEDDGERWGELMTPVVSLLEDLLLVGDFDAAAELVTVVVAEAAGSGPTNHRQQATIAIDLLVSGAMIGHIVTHLATIDEAQFERLNRLCVSLGEVLVRPLAEALSAEERPRTRQRLTAMLLAFGAVARRPLERLKSSQNPGVRRTAIHMLREFGGSDALPDLAELLDDNEPQVQREAVRAILNVGTQAGYTILERALARGTTRSRETIMQSVGMVRDERATPLFAYILAHVDHRGALAPVYLGAIESLGALKDPSSVPPLKEALTKGEWWAPRRSAAIRNAAAAALARIGTPEAVTALEEALTGGTRGIRAAARAWLPSTDGRRRSAR